MPGNPAIVALAAELAFAEGKYGAADTQLTRLKAEQRGSPLWQSYTGGALALLRGQQGKLGEAEQRARETAAAAEDRRMPQDYFNATFGLAEVDIRYRNRAADGLAKVSALLARRPLDSLPALDRPYLSLANVYALAGKPDQAKRYVREWEQTIPQGARAGDFSSDLVTGLIAEAEGRTREAITAYRKYYEESGGCGLCGLYELAGVYDRSGQADSARAAYEAFVTTPTLNRLYQTSLTLAPSLKRLGELYEAKGDRKKATEYYSKFVEVWKDADPELQPGVKEIRGRMARLAQEPGT